MSADDKQVRLVNPIGRDSFSEWPTAIGIEVTNRCQLRCRHCFNESGPAGGQELPWSLLVRTLDEMQQWQVQQVRITGGEPTLYSRLADLLHACSERAIQVTLNTHGNLADTLLDRLLRGPIERFILSLDGMEDAHDLVRGAGSFSWAVATCRRLGDAGRPVTIACHIGRHNLGDIADLAALASTLGADLKLTPLRPLGRVLDALPQAVPEPEDCLAAASAVPRLRRCHPQIRIMTDFDLFDQCPEPFAITDAKSACGAGRVMVSVAATGDVYPCAFFYTRGREFSAGNLKEQTLGEIWRHSPVFTPFRVHTKAPTCQGCAHYRQRCAGGCAAVAHFRAGALDALDPNCFVHLLTTPP